MAPYPDLMVFCHLRWDFVYQRPQHLMSRLAAKRRVLFIEEPQFTEGESSWDLSNPEPNVTVCRPRTNVRAPGYSDEQMPQLNNLLRQLVRKLQVDSYVTWFYTPMALPLLAQLDPLAIVYDCMDELSKFAHAPEQLVERERQLLQIADVVFTGGPSLYRAKQDRADNVHCFPSSVNSSHFGQAARAMPDPDDQAGIPRPRLGFFGVIDERIDLPILDEMARQRPDWHIVMVGPVVKINPDTLPRHPNLHYLGQKGYADLPAYLANWDVCLLPFARNDATAFISPTKTLEYMAAQKPIVSTPITDVAEPYGHIVHLAEDGPSFIDACEQALEQGVSDQRRQSMIKVIRGTSWDRTAESMDELIDEAVEARAARKRQAQAGTRRQAPVVVIGAGPTGLSAAYHLGTGCILLEKGHSVGGLCQSDQAHGFTFDMAGHIMFSKDPYVHEMYRLLLGDNVHWQDREAWIYSKGVYTRYPFQGCLYGLPAEVIVECIMGAIEARFGPIGKGKALEDKVAQAAAGVKRNNGAAVNLDGKACEGDVKDCCADGVLESDVDLAEARSVGEGRDDDDEPRNFESFIYKVWGRGIARHFAIPYNRKLWAVPLSEMETSWLGGRVPMPDIEEMIRYALTPAAKPMGPNARFGYPLRGGFEALMRGFLPYVRQSLLLNSQVAFLSPSRHTLRTSDGREFRYEHLISTMPLPLLVRAIGHEAPPAVRDAARGLRHVSVRCVNLGIGREKITDKHWIYYPEDTVFHRIFVQGNASPHNNPRGGFGLTCEITYSPHKPLPVDGDALIDRCIQDCVKVGLLREDDPIWAAGQVDLPYAYVVYDHQRQRNVETIRAWLAKHDIVLAGRYSEWEYYNSDHAFIAGKKAAERVLAAQRGAELTVVEE
jgi:UDP-galactopyranose mutase